ncbi:MAG: nucleotidyltransferase family protein [Bacteroidia bacterium]
MNRQSIFNAIKLNAAKLKQFGVRNIGLFGSYARNEQNENSDLDILVDFEPEQESFDNLMNIYDLLESVFKGIKVEIVTKNGLSDYIGPYILKEVEYVQIG